MKNQEFKLIVCMWKFQNFGYHFEVLDVNEDLVPVITINYDTLYDADQVWIWNNIGIHYLETFFTKLYMCNNSDLALVSIGSEKKKNLAYSVQLPLVSSSAHANCTMIISKWQWLRRNRSPRGWDDSSQYCFHNASGWSGVCNYCSRSISIGDDLKMMTHKTRRKG